MINPTQRPVPPAGVFQPSSLLRRLIGLSAAVVVAILGLGAPGVAQAQLSDEAMARAKTQISAISADKAARTPAERKMDSHLILAARQLATGKMIPAAPKLRMGVKLTPDNFVEVDIDGQITPAFLDALKTAGGRDFHSYPDLHTVRVTLPLGVIETIAARPEVKFIARAAHAEHSTGSVDSEGDTTHEAISARSTYSVTGAGVKVGVLSDSADDSNGSYAAAVASGDIDGSNTTILSGQGGTGEGEGLAMMEIVHDIAPDAAIEFATGDASSAGMATNIRSLASAGCNIICDDISYSGESPFQDSDISEAVDDVTAEGVFYFSCARNSGNLEQGTASVWEGDFLDGGDASSLDGTGSRYHEFTGGSTTSVTNEILSNGQSGGIDLFWSDPLNNSTNDYDLFEVDEFGDVIESSTNEQSTANPGNPYESIDTATPGDYVVIVKFNGDTRALHVEVGRLELTLVSNGAVRGHNANGSSGAFTVAATPAHAAFESGDPTGPYPNPFNSSNETETFSCDGPRQMFYNRDGTPITSGKVTFASGGGTTLAKPDFTAADGVVTTLPQGQGLNPFYGTSAATPHAAALAALAVSLNPSITAAELASALKSGVVAIDENADTAGAGILLAPNILANVTPPASGTLAWGASKYSFDEDSGTITIHALRTNGSFGAITVKAATASGTAKSGTDYTGNSQTLSWANGDTSQKGFSVALKDLKITDGSTRSFTVVLSSPTGNATLGTPSTATITIKENDPAGTLAFLSSTASVSEDAGSLTIHATRTNGSDGAVSVSCQTFGGTAKSGTDYTGTTQTLSWADGDTAEKSFTILLKDPGVTDGSTRTFTAKLSSPTGNAKIGSPSTNTITINENDPVQGELEFASSSYSVDETAGTVTVHLDRKAGSTGAVSVTCGTVGGTAKSGTDYVGSSKTISWAAGDTAQKSFPITIKNRGASGGGGLEFSVKLSSPSGGAVLASPSTATITIN